MKLRNLFLQPSKHSHLLFLTFITKFFAYLSLKGIYPLVAFLETDWQISRDDFSTLLAVSEVFAVPAVFIAPLADKYNVKAFCVLSWLIIGLTTVAQAFDFNDPALVATSNGTEVLLETNSNSYTYFIFIRILFTMSTQVFITSNLTILLSAVPEDIKHAAAGIVEYSWALSALIGIPIVSLIYDQLGAFWAFMIPGIIMLVIAVDLGVFFATREIKVKHEAQHFTMKSLITDLRHISFVLLCAHLIFVFLPYNGLFTVIGLWFSDEFNQDVGEIGISFFIIGAAEFAGAAAYSYVAAHYHDSIFKGAYIATGIFFCATAVLAFLESYLPALLFVFLGFSSFEYIAVAVIIGASDFILPKHRVTALALHASVGFFGRSIGAILSQRLYSNFTFRTTLLCLCVIIFLSGILLVGANSFRRDFSIKQTQEAEEIPVKEDITQKEALTRT